MREAIEQFKTAICNAGLHPPDVIEPDGEIHRFSSNGERHDDAGWYMFRDGAVPGGCFGDWRTGVRETWHANTGRKLSSEEQGAFQAHIESARREQEAKAAERKAAARTTALAIWDAAAPASDEHPYLVSKAVKAHGIRAHDSSLVVPVRDGSTLHSLQFITSSGEKRFLAGGQVAGGFYSIGRPKRILCIVEGYATGASIYEATGYAVAVAFNAGNLLPVAQAVRAAFPGLTLILCADDDVNTSGNPGVTKAREAAVAVGGLLARPEFGENRPAYSTDFNDLHAHLGGEAVRACIERAAVASSDSTTEAGDWPEPTPINAELKVVPAFDGKTLLPDALRPWIMDEAERMPCPPDFIAMAALVALGSIIGARCAVKPKSHDSWLIVPNLWGGIVGDPSAKKSPAWGAALKPVDRLIAKAQETYQAQLTDYATDKLVQGAHREAITNRVKQAARKPSGDPAAIARELRVHDEQALKEPILRRFRTNDCTVEKLGEMLRENPAGMLVLRDELVGLLASWEKEGREGERAFFLEGWNGDQRFDTDRIGRGHVSIPNLCISIFGGIQPDKLTVYLQQATHALGNDGMLQRFQLLTYPDPHPWVWRDRSPDKRARDVAFNVFELLAAFDPVEWGAAPEDESTKFPYFRFDDEAQELFIEWTTELHRTRLVKEDDAIIRQHLAKFDKLFPALALIFHLVNCAASGARGPVGRESALRAGAMCEYLEAHARRCYGLLKDGGVQAAQTLISKLKRGALEDGFTLRDVRRNQWRSLTTDVDIQAALDWAEADGWMRRESTGGTGPGSGRRTVRYRINPKVKGNDQGEEK